MDLYNDNNYIIDLRYAKNASDIIFEFSSILENDLVKNKKIFLKLSDIELNQTQLQSIKSLINSINSILSVIETKNQQTQQAALAMGLVVENPEIAEDYTQTPIAVTVAEEAPTKETPKEPAKADIPEYKSNNEILDSKKSIEEVPIQEDDFEGIDADSTDEINYTFQQTQKIGEELDIIFDEEKKLEELLDHQPDAVEIEKMLQVDNEYTPQDFEIDNLPTMYLKQTLRSGQAVNYEGNIVIIGDAHCGSEINATGDITVWGILSGIAHAGSNGNEKARIRALKMNALQLRIADWYSRRPDGAKIISQERTNTFEPEEARVIDGVVALFKINEEIK